MKAFLRTLGGFALALSLTLALAPAAANAQAGVPQLIIANGGVFGPANTITVAAWQIPNSQYMIFDSLPASSVQHISIDGRVAYLCADSFLVAYDLDLHQRIAIASVPGARQTAMTSQGNLLVAKGFGGVGAQVEERDANSLALLHSYAGISGECEGIVVYNDSAYVAVPQGFGAATGKIAVLDLNTHTTQREIDLDTNGRIIKNLYLQGQTIYTVNQISYGGSYGIISTYDIVTGDLQHHRVDLSTSMGAAPSDDKLYAAFGGGIGAWSLTSQSLVDTNVVPGYWASMAVDTMARHIYVTETDYATYGRAFSYDFTGQIVDSLNIGVSPEAIAMDYNVVTNRQAETNATQILKSYPQPFGEQLFVDLKQVNGAKGELTVTDLAGQVVHRQAVGGANVVALSTEALAPGMYIVRVSSKGKTWTTKAVKAVR